MSELCPDEAAPSRTPSRVPFTDARRIAPARRSCPPLGVEGLRALAAEALRAVEEAR